MCSQKVLCTKGYNFGHWKLLQIKIKSWENIITIHAINSLNSGFKSTHSVFLVDIHLIFICGFRIKQERSWIFLHILILKQMYTLHAYMPMNSNMRMVKNVLCDKILQ